MTLTDAVILDLLVPAGQANVAPAVPAGYTEVLDDLRQGLPARITLTPTLSLAVTLATGQARLWMTADPAAAVSTGDAASAGLPGDAARPALRLHLLAGGRSVSAGPPVAGAVRLLPADPGLPAQIALVVLGWRLNAGTVAGPGLFGSWLRLAWRPVGAAAAAAAPPPARPQVPIQPGTAVGFPAVQDSSIAAEWQ
jgi:hypothetical protein